MDTEVYKKSKRAFYSTWGIKKTFKEVKTLN